MLRPSRMGSSSLEPRNLTDISKAIPDIIQGKIDLQSPLDIPIHVASVCLGLGWRPEHDNLGSQPSRIALVRLDASLDQALARDIVDLLERGHLGPDGMVSRVGGSDSEDHRSAEETDEMILLWPDHPLTENARSVGAASSCDEDDNSRHTVTSTLRSQLVGEDEILLGRFAHQDLLDPFHGPVVHLQSQDESV